MRRHPVTPVPHDVALLSVPQALPAPLVEHAAARAIDTRRRHDLTAAVANRPELAFTTLLELATATDSDAAFAAVTRRMCGDVDVRQVADHLRAVAGRSLAYGGLSFAGGFPYVARRLVAVLPEWALESMLDDDVDPWNAALPMAFSGRGVRLRALRRLVDLLQEMEGEDRSRAGKVVATAILSAGPDGWTDVAELVLDVTDPVLLRPLAGHLPNDERLIAHVLERSGLRDDPGRAAQVADLERRLDEARTDTQPPPAGAGDAGSCLTWEQALADVPEGIAWEQFWHLLDQAPHDQPTAEAVAAAVDALRPPT